VLNILWPLSTPTNDSEWQGVPAILNKGAYIVSVFRVVGEQPRRESAESHVDEQRATLYVALEVVSLVGI